MADVTCADASCDRAVFAKGLCKKHYGIARVSRLADQKCSTEGCDRPCGATRGLCPSCYQRLLAYGDPLAGPPRRKPRRQSSRTGTSSQYHKNHRMVRKARGPAWNYDCGHCGGKARTWAMRHGTDGSLPEHYLPLCWTCHAKYDVFANRLPSNIGSKRTPEQRENIRQAALRRWSDPAERERMKAVSTRREAAKRAAREAQ